MHPVHTEFPSHHLITLLLLPVNTQLLKVSLGKKERQLSHHALCIVIHVRIDAGAYIDYTCIVQSVPCRALCLELKFVFTVSMYVHYIRNQCKV